MKNVRHARLNACRVDVYAFVVSTFATTFDVFDFVDFARFVARSIFARYFASKRERTISYSFASNVHALFFACCIDVANSRRNTTRICFVVNVRDLSSRMMSFKIVFNAMSRTRTFVRERRALRVVDAFDVRFNFVMICPIVQRVVRVIA